MISEIAQHCRNLKYLKKTDVVAALAMVLMEDLMATILKLLVIKTI